MAKENLIIATRESPLALKQANEVKTCLEKIHPKLTVTLLGLTTQADRMLNTPLLQIGGKGLFVKELEEALLDGRADIAVHSMKDMPMYFPQGLCIPVMCEREDARDAFVSDTFSSILDLPSGARVGTSSLRRQSQLHAWRSDIRVINLRGNVNTRLQKLDKGEFDAIILAVAGLKRLHYENRIRSFLSLEQSLPAVGQGALGIECRENDKQTQALILPLNHEPTQVCVRAERAVCSYLEGGCHVPIAAYAEIIHDKLDLRALVAKMDGSLVLRAHRVGSQQSPEELGEQVAKDLLKQGAEEILKEINK